MNKYNTTPYYELKFKNLSPENKDAFTSLFEYFTKDKELDVLQVVFYVNIVLTCIDISELRIELSELVKNYDTSSLAQVENINRLRKDIAYFYEKLENKFRQVTTNTDKQ